MSIIKKLFNSFNKSDIEKWTIAKYVTKLITWYTSKKWCTILSKFWIYETTNVLKTVRDYHYFCRFELENMSIYRIIGNFCGVKFLRFWSKKRHLNFAFFFLLIENLGTKNKIVCITESNN